MKILLALLAFLISAGVASAQDDAAIRRILERVEVEFNKRRTKLNHEIRAIIQQEMKRALQAPAKPAPSKPKAKKPQKKQQQKPKAKPPGKRVRLGIVAEDFDEGERKKLGIGGGIKIAEVQDPAKKAGLRAGDVLLELGGKPVTEDSILGMLETRRPGDVVKVTVLRKGKRKTFDLKLAERGE